MSENDENKHIKKAEETPENSQKEAPSEENKQEQEKPLEFRKPESNASEQSANKESSYQVSLVNENVLKVKIRSGREINVKYNAPEGEKEFIIQQPPLGKKREVDLEISISSELKEVPEVMVVPGITEEKHNIISDSISAIKNFASTEEPEEISSETSEPKSADEVLYERLYKKNPFILFRKSYRRNLTKGLVGAVIIFLCAVGMFSIYASKQKTPQVEPEQRLIVIQDMPEPKINLENVQDPNAPEEEQTDETSPPTKKIPITRGPRIVRPRTNEVSTTGVDTTGLAEKERLLDSMRMANNDTSLNNNNNNSNNNTVSTIPDSMKTTFSMTDVGLTLSYPKNWRLTDSREINKNITAFEGLILADTTAREGTFSMFLQLDNDQKEYSKYDFTLVYELDDTTATAFKTEPKVEAGKTHYRFYIFSKTDKMVVVASVNSDQFEKYRGAVEAVVRSIRISRPGA